MQIFVLFLISAIFGFSGSSSGADIKIVTEKKAKALEGAVLVLKSRDGAPLNGQEGAVVNIGQKGSMFVPFVSAITVNSRVIFTNEDRHKHQIYSFSKTKPFEISLFARDEVRNIGFDQPGIVALGCNIHDNMLAYLYIADTGVPYVANSKGRIVDSVIVPGVYQVEVWYPGLEGAEAREIVVEAGKDTLITLDARRQYQDEPAEEY